MRKIVFTLVALWSIVFISGCSNNSNNDNSSNESDTVEIQSDKGLKVNWKKDVTPIIEKETNLKLNLIDTNDITAYITSIKQSLSSQKAPSLFTWWTGTQLAELQANDLIAEITDEEWNELVDLGISDDLKEGLSVDGKVYGAPLYTIYNGVFYSKKIYSDLGLKEPGTLEEFVENCRKIKEAGITPVGVGSTWQSFVWPVTLVGSFDPGLYDKWTNGEIGFNDPQIKEVFYYWAEMLREGYFTEQQQDQGKDLAMGETAMVLNANSWSPGLEEDYGMKLGEDIDIFVLPNKGGEGKKTIFYEIAPFLIAKNGSKENALNVLKAFYSEEAQEGYAKKTGTSARTDTKIDNPITDKMMSSANNSDEYTLKLRYYEQFTPEIVNLSIDEYWKIIGNPTEEQVDESLNNIQQAWEEAQKELQ